MKRRELEIWLAEGLSLGEIGTLCGRHPSTVAYWLNKYGLRANGAAKHAPKGGIPRDDLEQLVTSGATLATIAARFEVSVATVRHWIKRYRLPRPAVNRRSDIDLARKRGERTVFRSCPRHGRAVFVIEQSGRARCRRCRVERVSEWRRRAKATLIAEAGGKCTICGYERCQAALQFHHREPARKAFGVSLCGSVRSLDALRREAAKCVLLCANCHAEVEVGYTSL